MLIALWNWRLVGINLLEGEYLQFFLFLNQVNTGMDTI